MAHLTEEHFHTLLVLLALFGTGKSQYFVDPGVTLVKSFEGWVTSFAWWPDVLGAMPEAVISQVTEDVFSVVNSTYAQKIKGLHG